MSIADLTAEDWAAVDRARDLRIIAEAEMEPTRERLTSIISTAIHGLHDGLNKTPATEQDLQGVEFALRRLKALVKRMRTSIRAGERAEAPVVLGSDVQQRLQDAQLAARDLLADEPWRVTCVLSGATRVHYTAKHHDGDVSVHVHASSLQELVRGIDAVALEDLSTVDEAAAA